MTNEVPGLSVVGLGEALFDCFPDHVVLGGAPLNMAYHAHQLLASTGGRGIVASRIGSDALGDRLLEELGQRGLSRDFIQRDEAAPTGEVRVQLAECGEPSYDIVGDVAWDRLEYDEAFQRLARECSAVCFGTLAQRGQQSRSAIQRFVADAARAIRIFDVNLRQQHYSADVLESSLRLATVTKLNEDELAECCSLLEVSARRDNTDECAMALRDAFSLDAVAVTRGARGTVLYTPNERLEGEASSFPRQPKADSVGAGDACCAALIVGRLLNYPPAEIVRLANLVGGFVASRAGATPPLPAEILQLMKPMETTTPAPPADDSSIVTRYWT